LLELIYILSTVRSWLNLCAKRACRFGLILRAARAVEVA